MSQCTVTWPVHPAGTCVRGQIIHLCGEEAGHTAGDSPQHVCWFCGKPRPGSGRS